MEQDLEWQLHSPPEDPRSCARPCGGSEGEPDPERPMVSSCGLLGRGLTPAKGQGACVAGRGAPLGNPPGLLSLKPGPGGPGGPCLAFPPLLRRLPPGARQASPGLPGQPGCPTWTAPPASPALVLTVTSDPQQAEGRLRAGVRGFQDLATANCICSSGCLRQKPPRGLPALVL